MTQFFKDYGALVSPTIAFLLGIIAVALKYKLDNRTRKTHTTKCFRKAVSILAKIDLSEYKERF